MWPDDVFGTDDMDVVEQRDVLKKIFLDPVSGVSVCVCVWCVYVYMCLCVCVYLCVFICVYLSVYACICVCLCVGVSDLCMYACLFVCLSVCLCYSSTLDIDKTFPSPHRADVRWHRRCSNG